MKNPKLVGKMITKKKLINYSLAIALLLLMSSCRYGTNRQMDIFYLTVLQLINFALVGGLSITFSVLSQTTGKDVYKIIGWITTAIFALLYFKGATKIISLEPSSPIVWGVLFIELGFIVACVVLLVKKPKEKGDQKQTQPNQKITETPTSKEEEIY